MLAVLLLGLYRRGFTFCNGFDGRFDMFKKLCSFGAWPEGVWDFWLRRRASNSGSHRRDRWRTMDSNDVRVKVKGFGRSDMSRSLETHDYVRNPRYLGLRWTIQNESNRRVKGNRPTGIILFVLNLPSTNLRGSFWALCGEFWLPLPHQDSLWKYLWIADIFPTS